MVRKEDLAVDTYNCSVKCSISGSNASSHCVAIISCKLNNGLCVKELSDRGNVGSEKYRVGSSSSSRREGTSL